MQANPALRKLGFSNDDRVVIIHTDDIGMCEASVSAYTDLAEFGLISSAAVMVPCGWFPATADYCRGNAAVDMGVHLTLTSEWSAYRWGPISGVPGLVDEDGYFYGSSAGIQDNGNADSAAAEIEAQIQRALAAGVDATHLDTHMGSVFHPRYLQLYIDAGLRHGVVPMLFRRSIGELSGRGFSAEQVAQVDQSLMLLEEQGVPLLDYIVMMPLDDLWDSRVEQAKALLRTVQPGITHFILHPSKDTPELRAITPGDWRHRAADYEAFMSEDLRGFIQHEGIQIIGYRALRDLMR